MQSIHMDKLTKILNKVENRRCEIKQQFSKNDKERTIIHYTICMKGKISTSCMQE